MVCEIPFVLIQTTYYTLITYAMMCFEWTVVKFFWFFFVSFFSFLYFTYYGMMAVAITPNQQVAAIFAGAFYGLFNLFSGFLIPRPVSFGFVPRKKLNLRVFKAFDFLSWFYFSAEDSEMVDMDVLLEPYVMGFEWIAHISVW